MIWLNGWVRLKLANCTKLVIHFRYLYRKCSRTYFILEIYCMDFKLILYVYRFDLNQKLKYRKGGGSFLGLDRKVM